MASEEIAITILNRDGALDIVTNCAAHRDSKTGGSWTHWYDLATADAHVEAVVALNMNGTLDIVTARDGGQNYYHLPNETGSISIDIAFDRIIQESNHA